MKIELPGDILITKQLTHCAFCRADPKVFCPRDHDCACLECGECFCAGHILIHMKNVHFVESSMEHCTKNV